jgi:propanol-preferring alcohol dehydrogenase
MSGGGLEGRMMATMRAMVLDKPGTPLLMRERPVPVPAPGEILITVSACGVCRTDLHVVDGELKHPKLPLVPGHEIVGRVAALGSGVSGLALHERVGVPWLGATCGKCPYCRSGRENLCDHPVFTGYTRDGGFATHTVADARFCFPLAEAGDDAELAPWLCAGLIGWRSYRMAGEGATLGLYGFGAAAHILAQVARWQGRRIYAFTRKGDTAAQDFARSLGATWAGGSEETPPERLDAAIIFAPVGALVPAALKAVKKGGRVVCGGIHMSDIPSFPYALLWEERTVMSVANLTRQDAREFLEIAPKAGVHAEVTRYPLAQANEALSDLRDGRLQGAAVLIP